MLVADYIVEFLVRKGITDVFGYPGGMIAPFMEALRKSSRQIRAHVTYHEQSAAFAACGYSQTSRKPGVAYASSGPGATNLITGICNAYFDSIPCIFITGQVNTTESKSEYGVRQRGFQETDIVSMVKSVTKYAVSLTDASKVQEVFQLAFDAATTGRHGPVLVDVPMDILRAEVPAHEIYLSSHKLAKETDDQSFLMFLRKIVNSSERPTLLLGNGVKAAGAKRAAQELARQIDLPVVSSMVAVDLLGQAGNNMGFIGAYGHRAANFAIAKSDLVISIGTRLDIRQVGRDRENFARNAKLVRFDIDEGELSYRVHEDECQIRADIHTALRICGKLFRGRHYPEWNRICGILRTELKDIDESFPNHQLSKLSENIPDHSVIVADVGQNQVWVAQSFKCKNNQQILFSGGHGAMGYSLPAGIGSYYGSGRKKVFCITGDGGIQMNIQELQFIAREQIPIKIIVFNNKSLGMIRHFQEMYYDKKYYQTSAEGGYSAPDFAKIARAYGIESYSVAKIEDIPNSDVFENDSPLLIELRLNEKTYVFPKLRFGMPNQDQEPPIDREKYEYLMSL